MGLAPLGVRGAVRARPDLPWWVGLAGASPAFALPCAAGLRLRPFGRALTGWFALFGWGGGGENNHNAPKRQTLAALWRSVVAALEQCGCSDPLSFLL